MLKSVSPATTEWIFWENAVDIPQRNTEILKKMILIAEWRLIVADLKIHIARLLQVQIVLSGRT